MTHHHPTTDRRLSMDSKEFVWDSGEHTASQALLATPIIALLNQFGSKTVLDLGCGNGGLTARLVTAGFEAEGCDGSASGIEMARSTHANCRFWHQDLGTELPADRHGRYDAVVSTEVIEHLLLPRQLLVAARSALKPGGLLVISTPYHGYLKNLALALTGKFDSHWHPLRDFGHVKFFSRSTLTRLVEECSFEVLGYQTVGRIPSFAKSMIVHARSPL